MSSWTSRTVGRRGRRGFRPCALRDGVWDPVSCSIRKTTHNSSISRLFGASSWHLTTFRSRLGLRSIRSQRTCWHSASPTRLLTPPLWTGVILLCALLQLLLPFAAGQLARAAALAGLGVAVHARGLIPDGLTEMNASYRLPELANVEFVVMGARTGQRGPLRRWPGPSWRTAIAVSGRVEDNKLTKGRTHARELLLAERARRRLHDRRRLHVKAAWGRSRRRPFFDG